MITAIIVLNVALIGFVVIGMLALLGWGVATDRPMRVALDRRAQSRARTRSPQPARRAGYGRAPGLGA